MRAEDVKAFLNRPWDELRRRKDRHNRERVERLGPEEALRLADELRRWAREVRGPPSKQERAADLAVHIQMRKLLDRTGAARSR